MKGGGFLVLLFLLFCFLFGVSAVFSAIRKIFRGQTRSVPAPTLAQPNAPNPPSAPLGAASATTVDASIDSLNTLFQLRQNGGLTQEEFEQIKRQLLAANQEKGIKHSLIFHA